jgi:hypothetical protein
MVTVCILLSIYYGNSFTISNMTTHSSNNICQEALLLFSNRKFTQWAGIPSECSISDVFKLFKPDLEDYAVSILGSEYIQTSYKVCSLDNYPEPIQVWFRGEKIVKIEAQYVNLSSDQFEAILQAFGEPVNKFDYYLGSVLTLQAEWTFPERGISLFLNGDHTGLVKISVYHPTSLDEYTRRIRVRSAPAKEFPLKS